MTVPLDVDHWLVSEKSIVEIKLKTTLTALLVTTLFSVAASGEEN